MVSKFSFFAVFFTLLGLYPSFTLLESSQQAYSGGIASAGRGTKYIIQLKTKTASNHLSIDYLYVDGIKIPVKILDSNKKEVNNFEKGSLISVIARKHTEDRRKNEPAFVPEWVEASFPINYNGAAVLSYCLNGKQRYSKIKQFKKLSSENKP
ncbi:MAG: hypothetical protein KAI79_00060 [Bacteroidales bacterium]|nr:hypothetical protein [Bacteroidales bacterium]